MSDIHVSGSIAWFFLVLIYTWPEFGPPDWLPQSPFFIAISTGMVPLTYVVLVEGQDLRTVFDNLSEELSGSVAEWLGGVAGQIALNMIVAAPLYMMFSIGLFYLGKKFGFYTYTWDMGFLFLVLQTILIGVSRVGFFDGFRR